MNNNKENKFILNDETPKKYCCKKCKKIIREKEKMNTPYLGNIYKLETKNASDEKTYMDSYEKGSEKSEKHNMLCMNCISAYLDKNGLDQRKKYNIKELFETLNGKDGGVAIVGAQGSGKSTVVESATKVFFLPKKGSMNNFWVFLLFLQLTLAIMLSFCSSSNWRKWIIKKISIRRWKYIDLNIWNTLGNRNLKPYLSLNNTFLLANENKKDVVKSNTIISKKEEIDEKETISWIFIKKSIWRNIFFKLSKLKSGYVNRLKSSIKNESFSLFTGEHKFLASLKWALMFLIFSGFFYGIIFLIINYSTNLDEVQKILIPFSGIFISSILQWYLRFLSRGIEVKSENELFTKPISNEIIGDFMRRKSKFRYTILHITELDRFISSLEYELGDEPKENENELIEYEWKKDVIARIVKFITECINLSYATGNVKILFEIDKNIMKKITGEKLLKTNQLDIGAKLFNKYIFVDHMKKEDFTRILLPLVIAILKRDYGYSIKSEKTKKINVGLYDKQIIHKLFLKWCLDELYINMENYVKKKFNKSVFSWRKKDEYINKMVSIFDSH